MDIMKKLLILISLLFALSFVGCNNIDVTSSKTDTTSSQIEFNSSEIVSLSVEEISSEETISSEQPTENITQPETSKTISTVETSTQTTTTATISIPSVENNSSNASTTSTPQSQPTHKERIDVTNPNEYVQYSWDINPETGEKIANSDTYVDKYGNVYDYQGYFLYNLSEWGIHYYTYEK